LWTHFQASLISKARGSTFYRGSVDRRDGLGAFVAVDGSALASYSALQSSSDDAEGLFVAGALALVLVSA
jgi:hypothetical protein